MVEPRGQRGNGMGPLGARAMARAMPGGTTAGLPGKLRRVVPRGQGAGGHRPWRIALALGLLGAGLWAMLDDQFALTSDTAVVSAFTVGLRSPIAGQVGGLRHSAGEAITIGTLLAVVEDDRADQQPLVALRAEQERARAELAGAEAAREAFRALAAELATRAATQREVAMAWYDSQLAEAPRSAEAPRDRQRQQTALLQWQRDAAARGVFLEIGINQAQQRLDELALRLAEQERSLASLRAGLALAETRLAAGQRHAAQQAVAELASPGSGLVWRVLAQDGERIAAGDTVAEVMDCASAFVLAAVPQDRAAEVQVGGIARFRLAGESRERSGRVQAVLGEGSVAAARNLAALPPRLPQGGALVRVALSPPAPGEAAGCLVGRSARLLLPTGEASFLGRLLAAR